MSQDRFHSVSGSARIVLVQEGREHGSSYRSPVAVGIDFIYYGVVGRLRPGFTLRQAQAEMATIGDRLTAAHPTPDRTFPGFRARLVPLLDHFADKTTQSAFWVLFGAVAVVLLIACANAASLLLARGAARSRELAIRTSLGAAHSRLLRQLLTETAILAVAAALLGLGLAAAGIRVLGATAPDGIYPATASSYVLTDSVPVLAKSAQLGITRLDQISLDSSVVIFTVALSTLTMLLFGLLPAWRLSRADPNHSLKPGAGSVRGSQGHYTRDLLIACECGLAVLLLAGSGLLIRSVVSLRAVDPGFRSDGVLLARVSLAPIAQRPTAQDVPGGRRRSFYNELFERLRAIPGVQSVGLITDLMVRGRTEGTIALSDRSPVPVGELAFAHVSPGLFETLQVPLRRGRYLSDADSLALVEINSLGFDQVRNRRLAQPVNVNEAFVHRFVREADPSGVKFTIGRERFEIVGVVGDMHRDGPDQPVIPEFFSPYVGQTSEVALRTSGEPLAIANAVREAVRSVDKNAMVLSTRTLDNRLSELNAGRRAQTWLLTASAALALALAFIGVYGLLRYDVAERRREIAVRIALGARTVDIIRLLVGHGMIAPLAGTCVGLIGALWSTRVLSHLLFETSATDPMTFASVIGLVLIAGLSASYLPARKAARVDPSVGLRCE